MKNTLLYIFILFLLPLFVLNAQDREKVIGKIVSNSRDLEGIVVQNLNTKDAVETEKGGYFNIKASVGDVLSFTAVHMIGITYEIKREDLKKRLLFVQMERSNNVLDEIYIDRSINSETLGFGKPKLYTPTQRNLIAATTSGGGIIAVDALVNSITGRTKMLESAVKLENERLEVEKIINNFDETYFTDYLKIPKEYIFSFGYSIYGDTEIIKHLKGVNKVYLDFLMSEKATQFLKKLKTENRN